MIIRCCRVAICSPHAQPLGLIYIAHNPIRALEIEPDAEAYSLLFVALFQLERFEEGMGTRIACFRIALKKLWPRADSNTRQCSLLRWAHSAGVLREVARGVRDDPDTG